MTRISKKGLRMSVTNKTADRVLGELKKNNPTCEFDPATILIIIQIIEAVLPFIVELCSKKPSDVPGLCGQAAKGGMLYRIARRQVRRSVGWRDYYAAGGDKLLDALLEVGKTSSVDEIERMYSEVSS